MELDWKLKGSNLLKFNCNKESIVHPETCTKMVQMDHNSNKSLYDWITNNGATDLKSCLGDWIDSSIIEVIYTPTYQSLDDSNSMLFGTINNTPVRIPFGTSSDASTPLFGVFKAGDGLNVDNGILNVGIATSDIIGGIKTGYLSSGLNKAVELDPQTQKAFVNLSGASINSTINSWYENTEFSSENLPKTYHVQTHANWNNYEVNGEFNTLFNDVIPAGSSRIYPICQDIEGKMFTFVPWSDTTYEIFNDARSGIVPYTSGVTNKNTKFLNAVGSWVSVPYSSLTDTPSVLSSQSHASNTNYLIKGSGYLVTPTKYLKEDGTWSVPTDTTYSADNESIIMDTGNIFYDPHQYSRTTNKYGEITDHLNLSKFRKIDYKVVGLPADSSTAELDLFNILNTIAKLSDNGSATITYGYDYDDELSWTMDSSSEFISQYSTGNIKLNIYGDIVVAADDSSDLPSSATSLTFSTGTTSTNTHHDIAFSFVKEESQIDLTIVCIKNVAVAIS